MCRLWSIVVTLFGAVLLSACATDNTSNQGSTTSPNVIGSAPSPAPSSPPTPASVPKNNESYGSSTAPTPAPTPIEPEKPAADIAMTEGTDLYDKGDFRGAIRRLTVARDGSEDTSTTKKASLKLLAFSYCITNQRALCRQQFNSLLAIEPTYELPRAEAGHPQWGPVFREAKTAAARKK